MNSKLHTIICSTRPGRVGPPIARWFHEFAILHGKFEAALIDLAEFNLPIYDEPEHSIKQSYYQEHTKKWAACVNAADAFVFVTPEFNSGLPPPLLNALNYLYKEWNYKPAGIVSYGGFSGGMHAAHVVRITLSTLKMVPMVEAVTIQNSFEHLHQKKDFKPTDHHIHSATLLLNELYKWAEVLKILR